ncbi:T9SS type A sorting domain-containing protein [Polluticoccus soli]|uniref:T9SS type A sorting domain-containing protein n=1 Tax=Polluticoccus soli TaxID=3034150 RepID=UPI0023E164A3|nr:T9SS type A sorting domain-containing protein [Flavipsychrobacter sp. JY13-12]
MGKHLLIVLAMITQFATNAQSYKGLYVDNLAKIIKNKKSTDSLLNYAQKNNYTTLSLYDLYPIHQQNNLTSVAGSKVLANFIKLAKTKYGIQQVAAVGENFWFFNTIIHAYNQLHNFSTERIDVYNLEFEFWNTSPAMASYICNNYLTPNNLPCTVQGAYTFYISELQKIHALAQTDGCVTETYIGWPDSMQAVGIIPHVDRVFVHAYVNNPANTFSYTQGRLEDFGSTDKTVQIIPLFSSEQSFLGPWLANNAETAVFSQYISAYNSTSGSWKAHINIGGYQWFKYTTMPYKWPAQFAHKGDAATGIETIDENEFRIGVGNGTLNIFTTATQPAAIAIYDLSGRLMQNSALQLSDGMAQLTLANNTPGMYVVMIADANTGSLLHRGRIVIQ